MPELAAQQRAELHKTIWRIAEDLRGNVDGWDFKQYVLSILFYRFISESITQWANETERHNNPCFDYTKLDDATAEEARHAIINAKGLYIAPSELFQNVAAHAEKDENLNMTLERIFSNIESSAMGTPSENDLRGLFQDADINSNKLGQTLKERNARLASILSAINHLDFGSSFEDNAIDAFGDAYEYLMRMYASNAGKSGGEFFTPQEVSDLIAKLALDGKAKVGTVYDPCCGSGSLLLRVVKILGPNNVKTIFGQELNQTSYNLCRMNMFLHGVNFDKFHIELGDTLENPQFEEEQPFDCIVSNPPYSSKWRGKNNVLFQTDPRFAPAGVLAPASKADLAFTMHMLSYLKTTGTAAIVEFPGVLYRSGAEKKIREYLLRNNFVSCVIQLPPDLFFGTSIATCIIVLKKSKTDNSVLFVDASKEFMHVGNKNQLSEENRAHILELVNAREDREYVAKLISNTDILENDATLSVSSYVEPEDTTPPIDIDKVEAELKEIVKHEQELRENIDVIVADLRS